MTPVNHIYVGFEGDENGRENKIRATGAGAYLIWEHGHLFAWPVLASFGLHGQGEPWCKELEGRQGRSFFFLLFSNGILFFAQKGLFGMVCD